MALFRRCVFSSQGRFFYYIFDDLAVVMYDTLTNSAALFQSDHERPNYWTSKSNLAYVDDGVLLVQHEKSVILIQLNFETLSAHRFQIYNLDFHLKYTNDLLYTHTSLLVCLPDLRQILYTNRPSNYREESRLWIANLVANDDDVALPQSPPYRVQVAHVLR